MHHSFYFKTVDIQDLRNDINDMSERESVNKRQKESRKTLIYQWDMHACGIQRSIQYH